MNIRKYLNISILKNYHGGGRGIRTPETLASLAVFKTAAFNHSAIPPSSIRLATTQPVTVGQLRLPQQPGQWISTGMTVDAGNLRASRGVRN